MNTPKPANILFVHNNNDLYGAEVALLAMLSRLDRSRFRPLVVLPSDTRHINRLSVELEKIDVEYMFIELGILRRRYLTGLKICGHVFRLLHGIISLSLLIRNRKIDIVHSNTLAVVDGACAAFITRRPHIWHVHELLVDPSWLRRAMHFVVPRLSTKVVANSEAVRIHLLADAPSCADRVQVILNGIDLAPFELASGASRVRQEWGVGADELLVGMIGKVTRWKGQLVLAKAAQRVIASQPSVKFAAVGGVFDNESHFMELFQSEVNRLGIGLRFIINGFRRDVPDILGAFDIFVLPSTWPEPFGLVVVEAMAAGKPVIATAQGGPLEIVVHGETGFLIPAGDECALAESILRLLAAPELIARFGEAGRRRASELFSVSRYVLEFENLYQSLLRASSACDR
jgi:glycosyltransferase involved in cell wall biosynthesis